MHGTGSVGWWSALDFSKLKWANTVDGIIPVVALVESPAVLVGITVMVLVANGPMVTALSGDGGGGFRESLSVLRNSCGKDN